MRMFVIWVLAWCGVASGQAPLLDPDRPADAPVIPVVSFQFQFEGVQPDNYSIAVESTGAAAYESQGPRLTDAPGVPYMLRFTVSEATRARIFELARRAGYFKGSFDYTRGRIANTGRKTLTYADANGSHEATYNWSENHAIQELTRLFQGIGNTVESGRRLQDLRKHDRLGIDAELRRMEDLVRRGLLAELQVVAPLLRELLRDEAVMRISRQRALRLLQGAKLPTTEGAPGGG